MNNEELHLRKLKSLIKKYSELGFEVFTELKGYDRPSPIENYIPDILLRKGKKIIIVEIKTRDSLTNSKEKIEALSKYAESNENVRFDLVLTSSKRKISKKEKEVSNKKLLEEIEKNMAKEIEILFESKLYGPGLILCTVLLESILNKIALNSRLIDRIEKRSLEYYANLLYNNKLISEEDQKRISDIIEARNKLMYEGFVLDSEEAMRIKEFLKAFIRYNS